jgi:23S rRNA (uracil1939-C5)-methyltransferase
LTLRGSASGGVALRIEGGESAAPRGRIIEAVPGLESCVWEPESGAPVTLAGEDRFVDWWQGVRFAMGPGVFLQANRAASAAMDGAIDASLGRMAGRRIVDLYAGVAARAIRWARQGARVEAVECDADACRAAREAAGRVDARVEVVEGSAEREAERTRGADVIVVNPPRTGLSGPVRAALTASGASRLVYVSCDPATLARDLGSLAERWAVERVLPFDAFPQTGHVEAVTWLRPAVEAA